MKILIGFIMSDKPIMVSLRAIIEAYIFVLLTNVAYGLKNGSRMRHLWDAIFGDPFFYVLIFVFLLPNLVKMLKKKD